MIRKRRSCLRTTAVLHARLLIALQSAVDAAAVCGVLFLGALPAEMGVFLLGRRGAGVGTLNTAWALTGAVGFSVALLGLYARLLATLLRSSAVRISEDWVGFARVSVAFGIPVGLGLLLTAVTGWIFWVLALFVGGALLTISLESLSNQSHRRWLLTADLAEVERNVPSLEAGS